MGVEVGVGAVAWFDTGVEAEESCDAVTLERLVDLDSVSRDWSGPFGRCSFCSRFSLRHEC